jgi:hypothetical protein
MKRRLWEFGLALVVLLAIGLSSCNKAGKSGHEDHGVDLSALPASIHGTTASASWAYPFVRWNERNYAITTTSVPKVGKDLGSVTTFSDRECTYTGVFSNFYEVGTKLFAIPNVNTSKVIAVQTGEGTYLEAVARE